MTIASVLIPSETAWHGEKFVSTPGFALPAAASEDGDQFCDHLRLGAQVCGEPAHDPGFGSGDFCVLLDKRYADTRYLRRLRSVSAAAAMAGGDGGRGDPVTGVTQ